MRPIPPGGTMLLDTREAAELLGAGPDRLAFLAARGFIQPFQTPRGPRWREDEIRVLAGAVAGVAPVLPRRMLTPGQAARVLGAGTQTLKNWAAQGRLAEHWQGGRRCYAADEIAALRAGRAAAAKAD